MKKKKNDTVTRKCKYIKYTQIGKHTQVVYNKDDTSNYEIAIF